jgi:hypothetical protein
VPRGGPQRVQEYSAEFKLAAVRLTVRVDPRSGRDCLPGIRTCPPFDELPN